MAVGWRAFAKTVRTLQPLRFQSDNNARGRRPPVVSDADQIPLHLEHLPPRVCDRSVHAFAYRENYSGLHQTGAVHNVNSERSGPSAVTDARCRRTGRVQSHAVIT